MTGFLSRYEAWPSVALFQRLSLGLLKIQVINKPGVAGAVL